jgi:ribosomal protein S18 acetylase RimI-like enzyme
MKVSKRAATSADTDFARDVHHSAYHDVILRQYGDWSADAQDKFFADAWSAATHEILLCDSMRCGYARIESANDEIYVHELVIDPDFQCRGIGTHVIKDVLAEATAREIPVRLQTHVHNRAANLYRRLGFRETDRTDTHILMEWTSAERAA